MKKTTIVLSILAASLMIFSRPALSEEGINGMSGETGQSDQYQQKTQKDQCLIVAMNCASDKDSVIHRVNRLRREIAKGSDVYSPEELQKLNDQLNFIYSEADNLFLSP